MSSTLPLSATGKWGDIVDDELGSSPSGGGNGGGGGNARTLSADLREVSCTAD